MKKVRFNNESLGYAKENICNGRKESSETDYLFTDYRCDYC